MNELRRLRFGQTAALSVTVSMSHLESHFCSSSVNYTILTRNVFDDDSDSVPGALASLMLQQFSIA
jgi:hypothetical protein